MSKNTGNKYSVLYKRPRNYNFTVVEKMHFLDCLQHYIGVTENRGLDTSSIVKKKQTWELLVAKYNKKFPHGPQRNYTQLKDLYRRMKILARRVYKQRSDPSESEDPIIVDEPTERLIEMMFHVNTLTSPADFLDVELRESPLNEEDDDSNKPIIGISHIMSLRCPDSDNLSDGEASNNGYATETNSGDSSMLPKTSSPKTIWTTNGEVKVPTGLVITEMPTLHQQVPLDVHRTNQKEARRKLEERSNASGQKISTDELNYELLKMAKREHDIKMKIHEANLDVLRLQKQKLLKDLKND